MPRPAPRGIRNNNPGNIRHGAGWVGLCPQQTDGDFCQFTDAVYGIRALARILLYYETTYKLNTVRTIIERWAPPVENDTDAYVNQVALALGVGPDQPISVLTYLQPLVTAIIKHENGIQPYSDDEIRQGVSLAV